MDEHPRVSVVEQATDIPPLVRSLGLGAPLPVLVLIGGAGGMSELQVRELTDYLRRYVLPVVQGVGAVVIDGGTDAGVMRAIGQMRRDSAGGFRLVGVVARGAVGPDPTVARGAATAPIEPNHTDVVVVPGETWGDEAPWLGEVASAIAGLNPSVTLLVNGGEIAYRDMAESLRRDRPVVVLAGSGRTADDVGAAVDADDAPTAAHRLARSPLTVVVPYDDGPRLRDVLEIMLGPGIIGR
jgi:hypothetical protein